MQQHSPITYRNPANFAVGSYSLHDRDTLVSNHLGKVRYLADRFAAKLPPSVERDDLYGAGVVGLLDAVERFDASRDIAFSTFAEMRVRGAILDYLRSLDRASRSTRRRVREIQTAFAETEQELGRSATEEEVAAKLGTSLVQLRNDLLELRGLTLANLDERDDETGLSLADMISDTRSGPHDNLENGQQRRLLADAIDRLPERERQVVALYYVEELTMKEIGSCLGVTESRVSQLRTQAILRLRNHLKR